MVLNAGHCWAVTKRDVHKIGALSQWCLRKLKWYHVRNYDVRRISEQPHLSSTVQARRLSLFGHTARMPDESDAKQILSASPLPPENWRRPSGRPHSTWMKTIQQDLKSVDLSVNEAIDMAQNRPLWRLMSTFGSTHSQWCMPETNERTSRKAHRGALISVSLTLSQTPVFTARPRIQSQCLCLFVSFYAPAFAGTLAPTQGDGQAGRPEWLVT